MATEPYRVEYHIVTTIYLEPGRILSGPDFARLWSGTSIFGKCKVGGDFWHGDSPISPKQQSFEIGSLAKVQQLLELGNQPIFGGGTHAKANLARGSTQDCDFYYAHSKGSRWFVGDTLPYLLYSVSGQWFEQTKIELVLEKFREHFEVADTYQAPYGLIDVASPEDCYAGLVYSSTFFGNSPLHRWVEQANWVYSGAKQRNRVRGIYWGNYLGTAILERLGGRKKFLDRYLEQSRIRNSKSNVRIWEFPNGVFVSLCHDPLGCKPGRPLDGIAASNLLWLVRELGSHGVLCSWCGPEIDPNHLENPGNFIRR